MRPPQHDIDVGRRVVVPEHSRLQLGRIRQIGTPRAQVESGCDGGVVDIVRVRDSIAIAIDAIGAPGGRDELHGADRSVPDGVSVQHSVVGVRNGGDTWRSVQSRTQNRSEGIAEGVHSPIAGVVGLDPPNPGEHCPR